MFSLLLYVFIALNGSCCNSTYNIELTKEDICLSAQEKELYNMIMKYRAENTLDKIPLSKKLTEVAQIHAKDLNENHYIENEKCNMHSWSNAERWKGCCYTSDHADPNCMWDKPNQINGYKGAGYEISYYYSGGVTAEAAIEGWKKSKSHDEVMINKGIWKQAKWTAIGVGIYSGYSTVWFGMVADETAENCK